MDGEIAFEKHVIIETGSPDHILIGRLEIDIRDSIAEFK